MSRLKVVVTAGLIAFSVAVAIATWKVASNLQEREEARFAKTPKVSFALNETKERQRAIDEARRALIMSGAERDKEEIYAKIPEFIDELAKAGLTYDTSAYVLKGYVSIPSLSLPLVEFLVGTSVLDAELRKSTGRGILH